MALTVLSLEEPDGFPLISAVRWIEGLFLGPIATVIAVLAVAAIGLSMLTGRIDVWRGARVILGCFMVFGALAIAEAFQQMAVGSISTSPEVRASIAQAAPDEPAPAPLPVAAMTDPYAGASLPAKR